MPVPSPRVLDTEEVHIACVSVSCQCCQADFTIVISKALCRTRCKTINLIPCISTTSRTTTKLSLCVAVSAFPQNEHRNNLQCLIVEQTEILSVIMGISKELTDWYIVRYTKSTTAYKLIANNTTHICAKCRMVDIMLRDRISRTPQNVASC